MKSLKMLAVGALATVLMVGGVSAAGTAQKPGTALGKEDTKAYAELEVVGSDANKFSIISSRDSEDKQTWENTTITIKNGNNVSLTEVPAQSAADAGTMNDRPAGNAYVGIRVKNSSSAITDRVIYRIDEVDANGNVITEGSVHTYLTDSSATEPGIWVGINLAKLEEAFRANTNITRYFRFVWNAGSKDDTKPEYYQTVKLVLDPSKVTLNALPEEGKTKQDWNAEYRAEILEEMAFGKEDKTTTPGEETKPGETTPSETTPSETTPNAPESTKPVEDVKNPNTGDNFGTLVSMISASAAGLFITFKKTILG